MRTTVDIDARVLARAKRLAAAQGRTLGTLVSDALSAYLGAKQGAPQDPPFDLLVRGTPAARFPTREDIAAIEDEDDVASLGMPEVRRRAAP